MDSRLEQWLLRLLAAQRLTFIFFADFLVQLVLTVIGLDAKRSLQLIRPVICITMKRMMMEPIVTASPVKPLKKNA